MAKQRIKRPRGYWRRSDVKQRQYLSGPFARKIWFAHKAHCESCGKVNFHQPATVALACFSGVALLKACIEERKTTNEKE